METAELNVQDCRNILALLNRGPAGGYGGMDEAEAAVVLKAKVVAIADRLQNPPVDAPEIPQEVLDDIERLKEETDGSELPSDAESGS